MSHKKILIVRNDKIGDFVLALPAIKLLKQSDSSLHITVLVPEYTQPIAAMFPFIDKVLIDSETASILAFKQQLVVEKFDAIIALYSTFRVAFACRLAGIKIRIAPATKLFQWLYNFPIKQRRSLSLKPEYEYNKDLIRFYIRELTDKKVAKSSPPYLSVIPEIKQALKTQFFEQNGLEGCKHLVFIHPGSGGSAKNLSKQQYADLAKHLHCEGNIIVFTAGPNELELVKEIATLLPLTPHIIYDSQGGLTTFIEFIAIADCFIGGSTGPLHIAGALNVKTVGFYPNRQSATSLRWKTLGDDNNVLSFSPPKNTGDEDMEAIDIERVAIKIKTSWKNIF